MDDYERNARMQYILLTNLPLADQDIDAIMSLLDSGLEKDPNNNYYRIKKGNLLIDKKLFEEALMEFENALKKEPDSDHIKNRIGICLMELHRYEDALPYFKKSGTNFSATQNYEICRENIISTTQKNGKLCFRTPDGKTERWSACSIDHLHYMCDIQNVPSILINGILSHNLAKEVEHIDFAQNKKHSEVQIRRSRKNLEISGKCLHDYVPLYFSTRTPMQWDLTQGTQNEKAILSQEDLVFIECDFSSVCDIEGRLFADGNAANNDTVFFQDLNELYRLNWDNINRMKTYWPNNKKYKREKMAEVLIPTCISPEHIKNLRVFNKLAAENLNFLLNQFIKKNPTIDLSHLGAIKCYLGDKSHYYLEEEIIQL